MKKILSVVMTVMLLLQMFIIPTFAAGINEVVFSDVQGSRGGTVSVTISVLDPVEAFNSLGIRDFVVYDKNDPEKKAVDDITFNSLTKNDSLSAIFNQPDNVKKSINIGYMASSTYVLDPAVTVNFDIAGDAAYGEYGVSATVIMKNSNTELSLNIVDGTITIADNRTEITGLSMEDKTVTYDGEAKTIDVTGEIPTGASAEYTITKMVEGREENVTSAVDAGEYTVTATVTGADYKDWTDSATLTITPKEVSLNIPAVETKEYDGNTAADEIQDALDGATVKTDTEDTVKVYFPEWDVTDTNAGDYTLDISGITLDNPNYTLKEDKVTLNYTIDRKVINVTLATATKVVGVDNYPLSYTNDALIGDDVLTGKPSVTITKDKAGEKYPIEQGTIKVDPEEHAGNYELKFNEAYLTIVEKKPAEVVVSGTLDKTVYWEGEIIDAAGLTVTAKYENGTEEVVSIADCVLNPSVAPEVDSDTIKTITVSYLDVAADKTFDITVKDNYITGIEVDADDAKDVYFVGDTLDKTGLVVTATYANGDTAELDADEYELSADLNVAKEDADVTVTADGKTDTYTVTVAAKDLKALKVNGSPVSLVEGQTFVLADSDVTFKLEWTDGTDEAITDVNIAEDNILVKKTNNNKEIAVSYTYTYGRYTATVENVIVLHVADKVVTSVEVVTNPTKTEYIEGTAFDPAGVQIKVTYNDGEEITADADHYAGYGISFDHGVLELGDETVTVACGGKTATITVKVNPRTLTGIEVTEYKDEYVDGESFDTADITVEASFDNEDKETVTDYTVDADTFVLAVATEAETRTVTVTYGDKTDSYEVTVVPCAAINETTGKRYAAIDEAFEDAEEGDEISIEIPADDVDVDVDVEVTISNNTGDEITITVNDEEITIADGESYTVEIEEEDAISDYYFFYMQMLQWRNRMFKISYKQTEGGEISGPASVRNGETAEITVTPDEGYAIADVLVNGKSVGAVESYKIRNIKSNQTVSAVFEKIAATSPFVDVSVDAPYFDAVLYVYNNGIINGVSETEMVFAPDTTMTRAMFVTVLGRMSGVNMADYPVVTFADCEAGSWYAPYVEWAAQAGIVKGYSAEAFGPMDEITVEQAAVILYRYIAYMGYNTAADADLANYADGAQVSEWAAEQMKWALANNIYVSDTTLDPQAPAARSLVAEMLYNLSVWMG